MGDVSTIYDGSGRVDVAFTTSAGAVIHKAYTGS